MKYIKLFIFLCFVFILFACDKTTGKINKIKKYKVVFNISENKKEEYTVYENTILNYFPKLTKEGHTFKHWYSKGESNINYTLKKPITNDLNLYPLFEKNEYNVSFKIDEKNTIIKKVKYDEKVLIDDELKKDGYKINSFINSATGEKIDLSSYQIKDNQYFTVLYDYIKEDKILISLKLNDFKYEYYVKNRQDEIKFPFLSLKGYNIKNYKDLDTDKLFDLKTKSLTEKLNIEAILEKKLMTISFMSISNGGAYTSDIFVPYSEKISDKLPYFTKPNCRFLYWKESDGTRFDTKKNIMNNITLYPEYELIETNSFDIKYKIDTNYVTITGLKNDIIKDLKIPEYIEDKKVTRIDDYAFSGNETLNEVIIPKTVNYIGDYAFANNTNLKKVSILSNDIINLNRGTFINNSKLEKLILPDSITIIDAYCFANCTSLSNIIFPKNLQEIGDYAFLKSTLDILIFPNNLLSIGSFAFYRNNNLYNIIFNEKLEKIDDCAFMNCNDLLDVKLPRNLKKLGYSVFYGSSSLLFITMYSNIDFNTDKNLFDSTKLKKITIIKVSDFKLPKNFNFDSINKIKINYSIFQET